MTVRIELLDGPGQPVLLLSLPQEALAFDRVQATRADVLALIDRTLPPPPKAPAPHAAVILDLGGVASLDESGVGLLVQVSSRLCKGHSAGLALIGVSQGVRALLALTRLDLVFPVYPDAATSLKDLRAHLRRGSQAPGCPAPLAMQIQIIERMHPAAPPDPGLTQPPPATPIH